jgi:hypothetical protein
MTHRSFVLIAVLLVAGCQGGTDTPAAPAASVAATATSNGIEALTAEQIMDRAQVALKEAPSFTFDGHQEFGDLRPHAEYTAVGDDLSGTMRISDIEAFRDATAEILLVDGVQYIKPSRKYWELTAGDQDVDLIVETVAGRWVRIEESASSFNAIFGRTSLLEDLALGTPAKGAPAEVDGRPALTMNIKNPAGSARVVTAGEPYPVQWRIGDNDVRLSEIGATFPAIEAPAGDQIIDMAAVTGKAAVGA